MEENLNNNQQPKKQEQKKKEPSIKTKKRKAKAAVITLSTIGVLLLGLQVYASTNGYGNVFFMIKNLITTGNPAGEQEIFSDKDITLSYKSIELAEGLKIQANRLEIKDGKTKIFLSVKSQDEKQLPLKYEVSTLNTDGTETAKKEIEGNKPENTAYFDYEDILTLDYEVEENAIITLRISDSSNKELRTLEINLQTREITVKGEKNFEKISQIELKKYLSAFSLLNDKSNYTVSDNLIEIATKIQAIDNSKILLKRETINEIAKQIYGENAKFETKKDSQGKDVEVLKDMRVGTYETLDDTYDLMEHDREGKCLKIEDIEFENDIYTVKYIYILATPEDINADKLEDLPQYETTIKLKRNENNTYSKYEIVSLESGIEVENKVSTDVNDEEKPSEELDYNHDQHYYFVVEHSGTKASDGGHTTLDGTHIEKCSVCNEERRVPHNFGKWFILKNSSGEVYAYTLWCNDCKDYVYTTDYNVVKNSRYGINEDNNITDTTNTNTISTNDNSTSENWKEFKTLNNATLKLPSNFVLLDEKYDYERYKTQYFEGAYFGGRIKVKYDVTLSSNMYPGSEDAKWYLGNNEERMVESKDNNGWTNWYPITDASRLFNNGFERKYGRVGNGQFEEITFTYDGINSCGLPQYKFMSDVMSSVNSKGLR